MDAEQKLIAIRQLLDQLTRTQSDWRVAGTATAAIIYVAQNFADTIDAIRDILNGNG